MRLEGKVAIITGGANGMGAEECRIFAREGAKVVIADVMEEEGKQVEAEIAESGGDAVFMKLDVTSESDWQEAVDAALARYGKLDILVNNAGISGTHHPDSMSVEAWDTFMDINAKGVFLGMKTVIPQMQSRGRRLHRQHIVHKRHRGAERNPHGLQRIQGRRPHRNQVRRRAVRPRRDTGKLRPSRRHAAHALIQRRQRPRYA